MVDHTYEDTKHIKDQYTGTKGYQKIAKNKTTTTLGNKKDQYKQTSSG